MTDLATLGIKIARDGTVAATGELDKLTAAAQRAEIAAGKLYNANFNKAARDYAAMVSKATEGLRGFDAIAARAAQHAQHLAAQLAKTTSWDVRNVEIQEYGRELDQLRARFNPLFAAQQKFRAVSDEINHAQRVGAITAQEATAALMREQTAYEALTGALNANSAAAGRNRIVNAAQGRVSAAHTTNLLFQAQDIAMMTAMGQAPGMLAMQQGMQVAGVFHQIGNGKQIVQALGGAIVGLLNPLNLATIAAIGFGAAGVQAFMNMGNKADEATSALESNREKLERLLTGYSRAKGIVDSVFEAAAKLPRGVVMSNLNASLREQERAAKDLNDRILRNNTSLAETVAFFEEIRRAGQAGGGGGSEVIDQAIQQIEMLRTLGVDVNSTRTELEAAATAAQEFFNTTEDDALKDMASDAGVLVMQLMALKTEALATGAAFDALDRDIQIRVAMDMEFGNAFSGLQDLYIDPRNRFDIAREQAKFAAEQASATATSYAKLVGVGDEYKRVLDSINAAEAEANAKAFAKDAKAAQKPFDQWKTASDNFVRQIEQQRMEIDLVGKTTFEISRQRAEFDLLTQAKQAGVDLNARLTGSQQTVAEWIRQSSDEYANLAVTMEQVQRQADLAISINNTLAQGFSNMFTGIVTGSKSAEEAIADLLGSLGQLLINQAFMSLFAGGTPSGIGGAIAGIFGGARAAGGPVQSGVTYLVGEKGPELFTPPLSGAIIPNHALRSAGASGADHGALQRAQIEISISVDEGGNIVPLVRQVAGEEADIRVDYNNRKVMPRMINDMKNNSMVVNG